MRKSREGETKGYSDDREGRVREGEKEIKRRIGQEE